MSTFISGGYDFHFGHLTVGPIAALQYTYVNIDGFSENGSLAPMQIQTDSADSLRTDVGFRAFLPMANRKGDDRTLAQSSLGT